MHKVFDLRAYLAQTFFYLRQQNGGEVGNHFILRLAALAIYDML